MRPSSRIMKGTAASLFACLLLTGCDENAVQKFATSQTQSPTVSQQSPVGGEQPPVGGYTINPPPEQTETEEIIQQQPHFEESELPKVPKISGEEVHVDEALFQPTLTAESTEFTGVGGPEPVSDCAANPDITCENAPLTSEVAEPTESAEAPGVEKPQEETPTTEAPPEEPSSSVEAPVDGGQNFASLTEARNSQTTEASFSISDEHSRVVFERDLTKAQGADVEVEIGGAIYGAKFETEVSLLAFEVGNDSTDIIQHALEIAGKRNIGVALSPTQHYVLSKRVSIPKGVKYLDGKGASIDVNTNASESEPTSAFEFVHGASGATVTNFSLDLADSKFTRGIAAIAVQDVVISGITMTGLSYRGIEMAADGGDLKNVRIENNRIENVVGEKETKGHVISISVSSERSEPDERFNSSPSPIWDRYTTDGTVSPNRFENSGISIINNDIHGGYYGISFSGVSNSEIRDNKVTANMRNISMQNNCNDNIVEHNNLSNSFSSSVHIAYNSNNNQVLNNTINSDRSHGQGLLQAYQDSDANTFMGNSVTIVGEQQPSWILYTGTDSDDNKFLNNTIDGAARRAVVGIESIWDGRSAESNLGGDRTNLHSYMSNGTIESPIDESRVNFGGGRGPLNNVTVQDNVFTPRNAKTPLIYVGAEVSGGRLGNERLIGDINGVNLVNNTIVGNECSELLKTHVGEIPEIGTAKINFINESVGNHKTS